MNRSVKVDNPLLLRGFIEPLLFSEQFSDVTFVIEASGEKIPGHRLILASASVMLARMLYGHFVEGSSREVKLSGVDSTTIRSLFRYIYTGSLDISLNEIVPLMKSADQYCITGAKEDIWAAAKSIVEEADCSEASIAQILSILSEAFETDLAELVGLCMDYVDVNTQEVLESKAFVEISFQLCQEIVKRDTLNDCLEETQVLLGILRWVRGWGDLNVQDSANYELPTLEPDRMESLRRLCSHIRLPLIAGEDLVKLIIPLGVFEDSVMVKALSFHFAPDFVEEGESEPFFRDRIGSKRPWTWSEDLIGAHIVLGNEGRTAVAQHYDWEKTVGAVEWHSGLHSFSCGIEMNVAGSSNSWLIIIGVAQPGTSPSGHLGSGPKEWGFACYSGIKISSNDKREEYTKPCKSNDIITAQVDFRRKSLEFFINGASQGVAFTNLSGPLRPAVSLLRGQRVTLKFD